MIGEDGRPVGPGHGAGEQIGDAVAVEDVVAQDQAEGLSPTKSAPMT